MGSIDEAVTLHKLDRHIAAKQMVAKAFRRGKRNQGRLRDLNRLRNERAKAGGITQRSMRMETGPADGGDNLLRPLTSTPAYQVSGRALFSAFQLADPAR